MPQCRGENAAVRLAYDLSQNQRSGTDSQTEASDDRRHRHLPIRVHEKERGRMPSGPQRRKHEGALQTSEATLQPIEREAAPADLFAEAVEQENQQRDSRQSDRW